MRDMTAHTIIIFPLPTQVLASSARRPFRAPSRSVRDPATHTLTISPTVIPESKTCWDATKLGTWTWISAGMCLPGCRPCFLTGF
ncbi:hypothetical protein BDP81DRAFT_12990 [Colletotrichum phormii]|uniref:Uncharacterized protein n=1 Tax=Colletotrichum phormii TaxID=359342 RepID=A0AAJ0ELV7_9PEZI|nr:uncharacterized protein BDP81DRAFT_12990 [Colletotrichum phormii]KAK1655952.1 hypothetical protein BDP81DRAFT_12990 [Colletotrichum phormii]